MSAIVINSTDSLQRVFGELREMFGKHKFLRLNVKTGKDRSLDQNAISHVWYEQLSRELPEEDAKRWKATCKLWFGVPILRAEDPEFREFYGRAIKDSLTYEEKLEAMEFVPVTSRMTTAQLSKYLEAMQQHFAKHGVHLDFPEA